MEVVDVRNVVIFIKIILTNMTTKLLGQSKVMSITRATGNTEVWFDKETSLYVIRKGYLRTNCVVDKLSEHNLRSIYNKIGKLLKIKGHKMAKPIKNFHKSLRK